MDDLGAATVVPAVWHCATPRGGRSVLDVYAVECDCSIVPTQEGVSCQTWLLREPREDSWASDAWELSTPSPRPWRSARCSPPRSSLTNRSGRAFAVARSPTTPTCWSGCDETVCPAFLFLPR